MSTIARASAPLCASVALLLWGPAAALGQGSGCEFLPGTSNVNSKPVGQNRVTYLSTPRISCDDGRYMQADSALQFEASGYSEFIGGVVFRDRGRTLRARHAAYYENLGRLEADGDVVLIEPDGNELRGERLLYLRRGRNRSVEQLVMGGGRPEAVLYPAGDSLAPDAPRPDSVEPYLVVADRLELQGEDIFQAYGDVEVERDSLTASADSLDYDQTGGSLALVGRPARLVRGELDLVGRRLRILLPGDVIEEVVAREEGVLTTDSLQVTAPFIRLFLEESEIRRLVAAVPGEEEGEGEGGGTSGVGGAEPGSGRGAGGAALAGRPSPGLGDADGEEAVDSALRAVATTREIVMRADSLDVLAPRQRLQRMVAVGSARAVSTARDSLNAPDTPELLRNDWIEGDTVVAIFTGGAPGEGPVVAAVGDSAASPDSAVSAVVATGRDSLPNPPEEPVGETGAPGDGAGEPGEARLETLRAVIDARSLYRLDPDSSQLRDTTSFRARLPATYVEARGIRLTFEDGQVVHFLYDGLRRGQQLQPLRLPGEQPDTAVGDTMGMPGDTASVPDTAASTPRSPASHPGGARRKEASAANRVRFPLPTRAAGGPPAMLPPTGPADARRRRPALRPPLRYPLLP